MLKTLTYLSAFAITMSVAHAANHAPSKKNYVSIGAIAKAQIDATNTSIDTNSGYKLAYGHRIDDNISVEVSYSQLLDVSGSSTANEIDLLSFTGLYHFSVGKSSPYVQLGYVDSNLETQLLDSRANGEDNGFVWGVVSIGNLITRPFVWAIAIVI